MNLFPMTDIPMGEPWELELSKILFLVTSPDETETSVEWIWLLALYTETYILFTVLNNNPLIYSICILTLSSFDTWKHSMEFMES